MRFITPLLLLGALAPAAMAVQSQMYLCRDSDCNDCLDTWFTFPDRSENVFVCYDTFAEFVSAWFVPKEHIDGSMALLGYWADEGTTGECGALDPLTGCTTAKVGAEGGCMEFMHPGGNLPPQMSIGYGLNCYPA